MARYATLQRTLDYLKGVKDSDHTLISELIICASQVVDRYCDRIFAQTTYDILVDGSGERTLRLPYFPLLDVTAVRSNPTDAVSITNTSTSQVATVNVNATGIVLTSISSAVTTTTTLLYATYPTLTLLVAAINAVSGWSALVSSGFDSNWASADLAIRDVSLGALNQSVVLKIHKDYANDYKTYLDSGMLYSSSGFSSGFENFRIQFSAGFNPIPNDLQQVVVELVSIMYKSIVINPNLVSQTLDMFSYQVNTDTTIDQLSLPAKMTLRSYRTLNIERLEPKTVRSLGLDNFFSSSRAKYL